MQSHHSFGYLNSKCYSLLPRKSHCISLFMKQIEKASLNNKVSTELQN